MKASELKKADKALRKLGYTTSTLEQRRNGKLEYKYLMFRNNKGELTFLRTYASFERFLTQVD